MSGGGGGSSQPTNTTVTQTSIPEYARPYVETALGQAAALTDINKNPYQVYGGERFAQFTPLQQQAFQGASTMTTAPQLGAATGMAGAAGLSALGTSYNPYATGQFTGSTAQQYMNPYMQNVVDVQQQAAQRQADIASQAQKAQFAQAGAFGGGRSAIAGAQAAADLARQKQGIQAQGSQQAYNQAQQQFNQEQQLREQSRQYGAGLQMQGLQTGLQAAGQLGQLGQQQFQQGMDINKLQAGYGGQQQQQVQNIMNAQYQDFLNARQYPYQQLGFMSDLLRGLPLSQSYSQTYQQPSSMLGQLAGLGLGAYSLSRKDGGSVHSYADGGLSSAYEFMQNSEPVMRMATGGDVSSDQFVENVIHKLSDTQLRQALNNALNRRDTKRAQEIQDELKQRAEASPMRGVSALMGQEPAEEGMARGGIVAFSQGGTYEGLEKLGKELEDLRAQARPSGGSRQIAVDPTIRERAEAAKAALPAKEKEYQDYALNFDPSLAKAAFASPTARGTGMRVQPETAPGLREPGKGLGSIASMNVPTVPPMGASESAEPTKSDLTSGEKGKSNLTPNEKGNAAKVAGAMAAATGTNPSDMLGSVKAMYEWFKEGDKQAFDAINARIDAMKGEAKEVKESAKMKALAQFGFQMAASAAQPGVGRGLAGALRAAGAAAPAITESMARSDELYRRMNDATNKLEIAQLQTRAALEKGNKQAAIQSINQERQFAAQQAQIAESIRHNRAIEGLTQQRYTSMDQAHAMKMAQLPIQARKQAAYEIMTEMKTNPFMMKDVGEDKNAIQRLINERAEMIQGKALMGMVSNVQKED